MNDEQRFARSLLTWRKHVWARLILGSATGLLFWPVVGRTITVLWVAGYVAQQLASAAFFNSDRTERLLRAERLSWVAVPVISLHAAYFGVLWMAAIATHDPTGLILAFICASSSLLPVLISSGGSLKWFLAGAFFSPTFICVVFPLAARANGAPLGQALSLSATGMVCTTMSLLAWRRNTRLLDSEADARAAAEAATAAKSTFIALVSHELRTPISAIQAGARLLASGEGTRAERAQAQLILEAGQMMRTLLDDLLDFSKIEAGRLSLEAAPFDLRATLTATARFWRAEARKKQVRLSLTGCRRIPQWVNGDSTRLRQILNNLLSNALKFTDRGYVRLRLDYAEHGVLSICVEDTGCGMAPASLARLFQPFSQGDDSITRTHGGTGLGLAISRDLAQAMGGDLTVESQLDVGSRFTLIAPMSRTAAPREVAVLAPADAAFSGLKILAVDDHEINRRVMALLLEPLGVELVLAEDGLSALEALKLGQFDLVMLDVHMPGLDGYEVASRIRASNGPNAGVPIVAVTGAVAEQDAARRQRAGMNHVVAKPIEPAALIAVLDAVRGQIGADQTAPPAAGARYA